MRVMQGNLLRSRFVLLGVVIFALVLGGISAERGLLKTIIYNFELAFPSQGQDYAHRQVSLTQTLMTRFRKLHDEADTYFYASHKGPRLDAAKSAARYSSLTKAEKMDSVTEQAPRETGAWSFMQEIPYFASVFIYFDPNIKQYNTEKQVVNRQNKTDQERVRAVHIPKIQLKGNGVIPDKKVGKENKVATLLFSINSNFSDGESSFSLTEVDRANAPLASAQASTQNNKIPEKQPIRNALYYGELMSKTKRKKEKMCLARAIYFEARGEPVHGQLAVAQVIMNRVRENYYPDSICKVVYEGAHRRNRCQFSFACDGRKDIPRDKKPWKLAKDLAKKTINGKVWLTDIKYASHYHATYVKPRWIKYMKRIKRVGAHIFYRGKFLPSSVAYYSKKDETS